MRSFLISLIPPLQISTVYTGAAMVSSAGGIIAGPILAITFKVGTRAGGRWLALPFYIVAALCFLILMTVCRVQLRKTDETEDATTSDEGGSPVERDQGGHETDRQWLQIMLQKQKNRHARQSSMSGRRYGFGGR